MVEIVVPRRLGPQALRDVVLSQTRAGGLQVDETYPLIPVPPPPSLQDKLAHIEQMRSLLARIVGDPEVVLVRGTVECVDQRLIESQLLVLSVQSDSPIDTLMDQDQQTL